MSRRIEPGIVLGIAVYLVLVATLIAAIATGRGTAAIVLGVLVTLPFVALGLDALWYRYRGRG